MKTILNKKFVENLYYIYISISRVVYTGYYYDHYTLYKYNEFYT